jgi:hypothetical protein
MARAFTDDVTIVVEDEQVRNVIYRLDIATMVIGMSMWANSVVDPWLQQRARNRFVAQGDGASGKWKPLTEFTQEWREMQGYSPDPINIRSGALAEWLIFEADGTFMEVGNHAGVYYWPGVHLPYDDFIAAKLHTANIGRKRGENKMLPNATTPKRPVVAIDSTDVLALLTSYHDFIVEFVGERAGTITASGTFGGKVSAPPLPGSVRGTAYPGGGGNF